MRTYRAPRWTHVVSTRLVARQRERHYGLPEGISFDHDSVFYDNQTASPFPTLLHLWLIALGIEVRFIHKPPPAEHARIKGIPFELVAGASNLPPDVAGALQALLEGNTKKVLISVALWLPYLLLSSRVNVTYRRRVPA